MNPINEDTIPGSIQLPTWVFVVFIVGLLAREGFWIKWIRHLWDMSMKEKEAQIAREIERGDRQNKISTELIGAVSKLTDMVKLLLNQRRRTTYED